MSMDHRDILELFDGDWRSDSDNRDDAYDDLRFLAGDQWDQRAKNERETYRRPVITINRMGQFVRQVTGDMRLNPISIGVVPVDDDSDIEKAQLHESIIRQIEYRSNATVAYAHAFECQAGIGIGHFRINTRYVPDTVDDQEIRIERIVNPLAVVWDSAAQELDRSDAMHCFVTDMVPERIFKEKYKGATVSDFPNDRASYGMYWQLGDYVRVAEFWEKQPYERTLALASDGSTLDITELTKAQRSWLPLAIDQDGKPRLRTFTDYKVRQSIVSGNEIIEADNEWAGRHIPIVPAIGTEVPLDDVTLRHGIVRWAKDPQRLYNYYRSSQAELIGQQPRAPFLITPNMIKGYEAIWNTANTSPRPYLPYNPDDKAPNGPKREQPPAASAALWQEAAIAADDMKATTGIYDASLGAKSNETSGKAIMARQREGDVGSYQYFDNFKTSIRRGGEILLDLIPKIYDSERVVQIMGIEDDEPSFERVNVQTVDGILNDLSVGRFDVRIKAGPSFSTKREEAREGMLAATQANPNLWNVAGDLLIKAFDWPYAQEISERIKRTIPPQITSEEEVPQQPDPMQQAMARLAAAKQEAEIGKTVAQTEKIQADTEKMVIDTIQGGNPHL